MRPGLCCTGALHCSSVGLLRPGRTVALPALSRSRRFAGGPHPVGVFRAYAIRAAHPLIEMQLFARRGFAAAVPTNLLLGIALFGAALLPPLYFEIVRGRSPL
jgi:hypothetical protein